MNAEHLSKANTGSNEIVRQKDTGAQILSLPLDGSWLVPAYSVYVAEIRKSEKRYYYVGQTGDAKYISARAPFHRLAGHLSYASGSTQNQIHQRASEIAVEEHPDLSARDAIDKWWSDAQIMFHHLRTSDFVSSASAHDHRTKRRMTLRVESALIQAMLQKQAKIWNRDLRPKRETLAPEEQRLVEMMLAHLAS